MKWYITGGYTGIGLRNDRTIPPLIAFGKDRVEALVQSGITVWSDDEYHAMLARLPEYQHPEDDTWLSKLP